MGTDLKAPTADSLELDAIDIHTIARYEANGYPWAEWDLLRETAPCYWYDRDGIAPFWAITRHADVKAIGSDARRFVNGGGRLRLKSLDIDARHAAGRRTRAELYGWDIDEPEDMVFFDAPKHTEFRLLTARHFTPARCRAMEGELLANARRLTADFRQRLAAGETVDLVHEYSVALPLMTIGSILGLDPRDWAEIHRWTDALFDVDSMRFAHHGEDRRSMRKRLHREFHDYVDRLIEAKRRSPADDLATVVVQAEVGGRPLTEQQLHGYLKLLIAAGNETTRNALSRGILAFVDHQDQVDRLCGDPGRFVDPGGGRGRAVDHTGHPIRQNRHGRRRTPRPDDRGRPARRAVVRRGQPGSPGVRSAVRLRHLPVTERAPRLRPRRALLPRRQPGEVGAPGRLFGPGRNRHPGQAGNGCRAGVADRPSRRRLQRGPGPVRSMILAGTPMKTSSS